MSERLGRIVKAYRTARGLSLRAAAREAGLSPSFWSDVENGRSDPSVNSLIAIAEALGVSKTSFLDETPEEPALRPGGYQVVRAGERPQIGLTRGVVWERLTQGEERGIEFLEIAYAPGADSGPDFVHHRGREWGLVLSGELRVDLGFGSVSLGPGDTIVFDSPTPHRLVNPGGAPLRAVWVIFDRI